MKKRVYRRNHSQTVNNFYTLATIVMMTVVITIYSKYIGVSSPNETLQQGQVTPSLLPCQTQLSIEQKITQPNLLKEAYEFLEQGNYIFNGGLILLDNSTLENQISLTKIESFFENTIDVVAVLNAQRYLNIKYELIEKTTNTLGLLVSFRISSNEVLRMYTKLNHTNENEILQKVECIMDSFKYHAKQ